MFMKKLFKFIPVAMGAIALVGCSNDDFGYADKNVDLSGKYALEVTVENDGSSMRSYWDNSNSSANMAFADGDILRVYDSNLQKYDNLESEGGVFTITQEKSNVLKDDDYAYALHAEDGCISYAGWNDGKNIALLKINADTKDYYSEKTIKVEDENVVLYKNAVPMWGEVEKTDNSSVTLQGADQYYKTNLKWLTPRVRVVFENGVQAGVQAVRVRSMKATAATEQQKEALEELVKTTNIVTYTATNPAEKTEEVDGLNVLENNDDAPLSGWFEAVLDVEEKRPLRVIDTETNPVQAENTNEIKVSVNITEDNDYTNVVYIPLTLVKDVDYEYLMVEYQTEDDWYFLRLINYGADIEKGFGRTNTYSNITVTTAKSEKVTTLKELNQLIASYANFNRDVTVDVELANDIEVKSSESKSGNWTFNGDLEDTQLIIPELENNIVLNFSGEHQLVAATDDEGTEVEKLLIEDKKEITSKGKTLTLNNLSTKLNVEVYTIQGIVIDGEFTSDLKVVNAGSLGLAGTYSGSVIVGSEDSSINGSVILAGSYDKGATIKATGDILVNGVEKKTGTDKKISLTSDATITIAGTIGTLETTGTTKVTTEGSVEHSWTHNSGNLTVQGTAKGGTVTVKGGAVVVEEGGSIATLTLQEGVTSATINGGSMKTLNTNGVPVALNGVDVTGTGETQGLQVKSAIDKAKGGVVINGGTIAALTGYEGEDAAKTTIKTVGTVDIKTVTTGDNLEFTSEIDDETEVVAVENAETIEIYTGAQLLALQGSSTLTSVKTINLNTDVTAANVEWTPSNILYNKATTFNGNKHKIDGLKIVKNGNTTTNIAFFSRINNTETVTVKELKLSGLSYDGEATANVAGLVGTVTSSVAIDAVDIVGKKLYGIDEVNNVGGLIARASNGDINIENTTVTFEEIAGKQYVGGLIGDDYSATSSHTATITVTGGDNNLVTVTTLTSSSNATTNNIATFGMLVGAVRSSNTTLTISGDKLYNLNLIAGHRDTYLYDKKTYTQDGATFKFMGVDGNYIGFSSAYDYTNNSSQKNTKTKVTIGTNNYTWNELNKFDVDVNWVK